MAYFAGRRGSTSSSASDSDEDTNNLTTQSYQYGADAIAGLAGSLPAPKKKHAFLKSTAESEGHDDGNTGEDGKIQSKLERCVENIDDAVAELAQGRGAMNWKLAHAKWCSIQADLKYVAANGAAKLPYAFLSTLSDTKDYFDKNSIEQLREDTPRDQKKHLADFHRDLLAACVTYKSQMDRMDDSDSADDDAEESLAPKQGLTNVFLEGETITEELVAKRLPEVRNLYGKKGTNRLVYINQLSQILDATEAFPRIQALVSSLLVSAHLDGARKAGALSPLKWNTAAKYLMSVMHLMAAHPNEITEVNPLGTKSNNNKNRGGQKAAADAVVKDPAAVTLDEAFIMTTAVSALASRMVEEYFDGVRNTEVYSDTYLLWLKAESALIKLLQQARSLYLGNKDCAEYVGVLTMNLLELVYYRQSEDHAKLIDKYGTFDLITKDLRTSVLALNDYVQQHGTTVEMKFYATLCVIYHLALHRDVQEAYYAFTSIRAADKVVTITDASVRLMYNRVLAQLCIAHFRAGNVHEAGNTVMNLFSLPKYRELLGQVPPRVNGKDRVEKALRTRFVPRHMHLNAEMLDVIFYLYCMLYRPKDSRIFVYRQFLAGYDRQQFLGPPENSRECVYAAVKAFRGLDWEACERHIRNIPVWGAFGEDTSFLVPIIHTVKVESLKNFVLQTRGSFTNISAQHLSDRFQLPVEIVRTTISRMLLNRDLSGVWDAEENYLHLESTAYTVVEQSLLDLADKATMLTEFTEKVQDTRENHPHNHHHHHHHNNMSGSNQRENRRPTYGGSRAPVARQLGAKNPFSSLRGSANAITVRNRKK